MAARNVHSERMASAAQKLDHYIRLPTYERFISAPREPTWSPDPLMLKRITKDLYNHIDRVWHESFKQELLQNLPDVYQWVRNVFLAGYGPDYLNHTTSLPWKTTLFGRMCGAAVVGEPSSGELFTYEKVVLMRNKWPEVCGYLSREMTVQGRRVEQLQCAYHYPQKIKCPSACARNWSTGFTEKEILLMEQHLLARRLQQKSYRNRKRQRRMNGGPQIVVGNMNGGPQLVVGVPESTN